MLISLMHSTLGELSCDQAGDSGAPPAGSRRRDRLLPFGRGSRPPRVCSGVGAGTAALLSATRSWDGASVLDTGGTTPSLHGAVQFAGVYGFAIWKALVVSLLIAAGLDALVPKGWLVRALARRSGWGQAAAGGLVSVPTMMCTCCTAPVVVSLRKAGVPVPAAVGYWLGNPLLNPAVLVFLFLVAAWQWGVVRLLVGALLVLGAGALAARVLGQTHARVPEQLLPQDVEVPPRPQQLPGRFVRSLGRLSAVLVPEYVVVVLLIGGRSRCSWPSPRWVLGLAWWGLFWSPCQP